jgi:predicted AlkP superfamily pyrophosphatase or phosphodiesterase
MNNIFNICFIFLLINYYLVNCSSISDYRLVNRSLRNVQNEDNDEEENEDDSTDIESDQKSDQNNSKNGKEDKSSLTPIDSSEKSQSGTKLMIILVDGFRFDYVSRDKNLKGFPRIAKSGVRAEYVKPIFPPNSYPNWYSIVTGLYGESHGMFENNMFDRTLNDFFLMVPHPNASHSHWWDKSEPIWITAEKNGVKAALYLWDGCQVLIRGRKPTICVEYKSLYESNIAFNETKRYVDKILDDFSHDKYRLALLYYELVDHTGLSFFYYYYSFSH